MRLLVAALLVAVPLASRAQEDERIDDLERSVQEMGVRLEVLSQAQQRTAQALAAAQGTLDLAGELEEARIERIGMLDDVINRAADADLAMMAGENVSSELARLESTLTDLHARAQSESGRLESDQEMAAAVAARQALDALRGSDLYTARGYLAAMATAAAGARDAAMGNAGRAWSP